MSANVSFAGRQHFRFAAFVELPGENGVTRVRYHQSREGWPWRCDECGAFRHPTCRHTLAAALAATERETQDTPDHPGPEHHPHKKEYQK